ncbi:recombinase RecA [Ureaplasma canigenitalium]|uniref:recombinase RecA n=1 Tax=Ureaplasma canigenitalium TaxID=42092 RepID=UPI0004E2791D|nr:recombinase RecA [Ureaplasma canigenitalium]
MKEKIKNEKQDPLACLQDKFNKNVFSTANEINEEKFITYSTGSISIDQLTGINGIPAGRITEIYGNESSGKTTIALQIAAEVQKQGKSVVMIDLEGSFDKNYSAKIGVDNSKMIVATPNTGEMVFEMIESLLDADNLGLIIVDSVAAMVPENEYNSDMNDQQMGAHARLMSKGLRKIQTKLSKSEVALIFINQIREKINVFFGNPEITTGGRALKFYSTIRLETRKVDLIKDGNNKVGIKIKVTCIKNKLANPLSNAFIDIFFGQGFDYNNEIIDFAIAYNIIKKSGSWFSFNDNKIGQGREQLKNKLLSDDKLFNQVKELTLNSLNTQQTPNEEI